MKLPRSPPDWKTWWRKNKTRANLGSFFTGAPGPLVRGKYLHWDELVHRAPPEGLTHEEWWFGLKARRSGLFKELPLRDRNGRSFKYLSIDPIPEHLHYIDMGAGGLIAMPEQITNPETKDQYYVGSLIEEAITSSQLEGAVTTRQVAKELIRTGRKPKDRSEQMILNNYATMQQIDEFKKQPLSKELVFAIHGRVTSDTLDDPSATGRFRRGNEPIIVGEYDGTVYHEPPPAGELERRMALMCDFANGKTPDYFVHPALRAILLHFWLAYDHPFVDGNGRSARALFYWSMARSGFWLFEFISISHIILRGPSKYQRAFLYTETDENDATYFILHQLDVIRRSVSSLHDYIGRKARQLRAVESDLRSVAVLNHRQRGLAAHALRHPHHRYTVRSHRTSHNVAYETARADLLGLSERGVLKAHKAGKTWIFVPADDLPGKLRRLR